MTAEAVARLVAAGVEWLPASQAALWCGVSRSTFERMVRRLGIKASRPGGPNGDRRFHVAAIRAALLSA